MNTRSKIHEAAMEDRGNNQEEHEEHKEDIETKTRDAIVELTENLHKISFGEPKDSNPQILAQITTCSQLKEELPAICNEVFTVLGPYNLEATYQQALALELRERGVVVLSEVEIPVLYKGQRVATRCVDLYLKLEKPVILELKAVVTGLKTEHLKQLKFYMTHFNVSEGYLINFPHVKGFPDEDNVQYIDHVLQPEGGAGISDRVTRSSTPRKNAIPYIIHVQQMKTTIKKLTGAKAAKAKKL